MNIKDVGLVIWGTKGGHRVFCTNTVVDPVNDLAIKNTLKDIRSYVRFNQNNVVTYALEFTERYKVYTIYRSCNDSGTGGYVSITVYVPHEIKITNLRELMGRMMDAYFKEYVHPLSGSYLPGKYDDPDPFKVMLINGAILENETEHFMSQPSKQNNIADLLIYDNIAVVDNYFDSPYHKEFFDCQEVMFMSRQVYDGIPTTLALNGNPRVITNVSAPVRKPKLNLQNISAHIKAFTLNGVPMATYADVPVNRGTQLGLTLTCDHYEDLTINGSIEQLIESGILEEKDKVITIRANRLVFKPRQYRLNITLNGQPRGNTIIGKRDSGNRVSILNDTISGNQLNETWQLAIAPSNLAPESFVLFDEAYKISDYYNATTQSVNIDLKVTRSTLNISTGRIGKAMLKVKFKQNAALDIPLASRKDESVTLTLPSQGEYAAPYEYSVIPSSYKLTAVGNSITIEPQDLIYTISIPNRYAKSLSGQLDYVLDGKSRMVNGKVVIGAEEDVTKGEIYIGGKEHFLVKEGNNGTIAPSMLIIETDGPADLIIDDQGQRVTKPMFLAARKKMGMITYPSVKFDESRYVGTDVDSKINGIRIKAISPISKRTTNPLEKRKTEIEYPVNDNPVNTQIEDIRIINCKGYSLIHGERTLKITDNETNWIAVTPDESYSTLTLTNGKNTCIIFKQESEYTNRDKVLNERAGFNVRYDSKGTSCTVSRDHQPSIFERLFSSAKAKIGLGIVAFLLVVGALSWIFSGQIADLFSGGSKPMMVAFSIDDNNSYKENLKANLTNEAPKGLNAKVENDTLISIAVTDKNLTMQQIVELIKRLNPNVEVWYKDPIDGTEKSYGNVNDQVAQGYNGLAKALYERLHKEGATNDVPFILMVNTPSQSATKRLTGETDFDRYEELLDMYPQMRQSLADLKWRYINENLNGDTTAISEFVQIFGPYVNYNPPIVNEAQATLAKAREEHLNAQAVSAHRESIRAAATQYISLMQDINCGPATLVKVNNWWNSLSEEDKQIAKSVKDIPTIVDAYDKYFKATTLDEAKNAASKGAFSKYQRNVALNFYCENTENFKKRKEIYKMSFSEPLKNGKVDNLGNRTE